MPTPDTLASLREARRLFAEITRDSDEPDALAQAHATLATAILAHYSATGSGDITEAHAHAATAAAWLGIAGMERVTAMADLAAAEAFWAQDREQQ